MLLGFTPNPGAAAGGGDFSVTNSISLNGSNEYLNLTFGTPTDAAVWTMSAWIYRTNSSGYHSVLATGGSIGIHLRSGDTVFNYYSGANKLGSETISNTTWHHIVANSDGDGWVDGVSDVSSFFSEGAMNNASGAHEIGRAFSLSSYCFNGNMAEFVFIDGQALDPTSFADAGSPKDPSGLTFGDNGFYLNFSNSSDLGEDASGNGNDWTLNNIDSSNQSTNVPT